MKELKNKNLSMVQTTPDASSGQFSPLPPSMSRIHRIQPLYLLIKHYLVLEKRYKILT